MTPENLGQGWDIRGLNITRAIDCKGEKCSCDHRVVRPVSCFYIFEPTHVMCLQTDIKQYAQVVK